MLFAPFVIEERALGDGLLYDIDGDGVAAAQSAADHLEVVERLSAVTAGCFDQQLERRILDAQLFGDLRKGTPENDPDSLGVQRLEHEDMAAGKQSVDYFKGRVLGGGADQHDGPGFHIGQKGILLGLVEPVNFIHKDQGLAILAVEAVFGLLHQHLDFADLAEDGAQRTEGMTRGLLDQPGDGGLAGARRPPENK